MEIWTSAPEKKIRDQELSKKKRRALPRKKNMGAAKKFCSWLLRGTLHILIVFNTFTFEVLNDGMCQKYLGGWKATALGFAECLWSGCLTGRHFLGIAFIDYFI